MSTYDLGDVVTLTTTVHDTDGTPVDATTVVCTVTAPDATTSTPAVSHPAVGVYTVTIEPATAGRYLARWVATGANAAAFVDSFDVYAAADAAAAITAGDLAVHLGRAISTADQPSADAACTFATAMVESFLGFGTSTLTGTDLVVCQGVALRIAAQWFTNPQDRQSFSGPEGLAFTASPQMLSQIMSAADRATLLGVQLKQAPGFA